MPEVGSRPTTGAPLTTGAPEPKLIPCLLLRGGAVHRTGPDGPVAALGPGGEALDPFDVVDRIAKDYPLLYIVDLDGIELNEPQVEYLQEFSRDLALWVDSGTRTSDQAIDVLVAGAQRVVLSAAHLEGPRQLSRAWRLTTEIVFEIELRTGRLAARSNWETSDARTLAATVRSLGPDRIVISPRETDPDWGLIREIAAGGPTWIDGTFEPADVARLDSSGARGGIFHIDTLLDEMAMEAPSGPSGG